MNIMMIILAILGLLALIYAVILQIKLSEKNNSLKEVEKLTEKKLKEAQDQIAIQKKEALIYAKETLQDQREEFEREAKDRRSELLKLEAKLEQREDRIESKAQEIYEKEHAANKKMDELYAKEDILADLVQKQTEELQRISCMSQEDARNILLQQIDKDLTQEYATRIKDTESKIKEFAEDKAREIVSNVMQRCAIDHVIESTVSVVSLPNDEMKGRIIGREGRNIRALETFTGVDLIIDDTPEAVVLSCFDPVKREIARSALEKLIADGRIHPVRIEEVVEKSKTEIDQKMFKEGENAAAQLGIVNLHPELIKLLGRLYFRTSYGQNVLTHSIEVGHLSGMIAKEFGLDPELAKRAGLLHDIGKAVDQTQEGTHIQLGVELARKYGEKEQIVHAIEAHHDDVSANTIEAVIVKIADSMSAGRPGARRDTLEIYIKRIQKLEEIATSFEGIKRSFAVQSGREVRVIVEPAAFDDDASTKLARDIASRIETELDYPGQIRVTVIREIRSTEIAK
ncbi:MAG: ribonuclease Y [Candidatus Gastranaerophilales bacterium]|nr:ribonuclease Y [Candidatus Gastranaerophilales bacterium]